MRGATDSNFAKWGVSWPALGVLACLLGCRSPLKVRHDAGPGNDSPAGDAPVADAVPDRAAPDPAPDLAGSDVATADGLSRDLGSSDLASDNSVPRGFRFENHSAQTAYVRTDGAIGCRMRGTSGWEDCSFFDLWCMPHCADVRGGESCCYQCEQPIPALYAIPPGTSRTLDWDGAIFTRAPGPCSDCECQQEMPAPDGHFQASVRVYFDYECSPSFCQLGSDGIVTMAYPRGTHTTYATSFAIPMPDDHVIIYIAPVPNADTGAAADAAASGDAVSTETLALRDASSDLLPAGFRDLPGYSFQILAGDTAPDASTNWGEACVPPARDAVVTLSFSDDGSVVKIVPISAGGEPAVVGTLEEIKRENLRYSLEAFAGGELFVFRDGIGRLVARVTLFGSGVPVVWCIEAPMKRVAP